MMIEELDALIDELDDLRDAARFAELKAEADADIRIPGEVVHLEIVNRLSPLAAWRTYRGMTQADLANAAGTTQATVARIESGKSAGRLATLKALAGVLDAPVSALRDED